LVVRLVHDAFGVERGEEAVLPGVEGRVAERPGVAALAAVVGVVVGDDVFEALDVGVGQLGEVGLDVVVEVDLSNFSNTVVVI